jgi:23S rRNA (uridine2552-2'-O)-methyltransferase
MAKSRTKSSIRWLERQHADPYTQEAKKLGYRGRAAFKLLEIQERDKIIAKGMRVVDLGAAPGGWSQVVIDILGKTGKLIALDKLPIESLTGVDIVQGDFQEQEIMEELRLRLENQAVDLVISDMAPNLSGINSVDQPRSMDLAELALDFAQEVLKVEGNFLVKVFQGAGFEAYWSMLKGQFKQVVIRKPKSSRKESREIYVLAKGFKGVIPEKELRGSDLERYA